MGLVWGTVGRTGGRVVIDPFLSGLDEIGDLGSFTLSASVFTEDLVEGGTPEDSSLSRSLLRLRICFPLCSILVRSLLVKGLNFDMLSLLFFTGTNCSLIVRSGAFETIGFCRGFPGSDSVLGGLASLLLRRSW